MNKALHQIKKHTNIFFIRHAETEHNAIRLIAGRQETVLTPQGVEQAKATSDFFKNKSIDYLLHSPLIRTKQTADLILENVSVPSSMEYPDIIEIDTGSFSGKTIIEIQDKDPDSYYKFKQHSWEGVEGAESIESIVSRCKSMWNTLGEIANKSDKGKYIENPVNILAITHGGFLQWIFKTALGTEGEHASTWAPIIRTTNCGIYQLNVEPIYDREKTHLGVHAMWNLLNHTCYN